MRHPRAMRVYLHFAALLALLLMSAVSQAQEFRVGRVRQEIRTLDDTTPIELGWLRVEDEITIEIVRLSGDLIPYVSLYNWSRERFAIRFEGEFEAPARVYDQLEYEINDEAGDGEYQLIVAHEQESGEATFGDFAVNIEILRDGMPVPIPDQMSVIRMAAAFPSATIVEVGSSQPYRGRVDDEHVYVYFLVELAAQEQVDIQLSNVSGGLDSFLALSYADEENYVGRGSDLLTYPSDDNLNDFTGGYFVIVVTRQDFEDGFSSGDFELQVTPHDND